MYHELAYLHPNHFTPDPKIVEAYGIDTSKPYFVMRFASLNAHHDSGIKGINTDIAQRLINILENSGSHSGLDHFESDPASACSLSDQLIPFSSACSLFPSSGNKLVPQIPTDPSQLVPLSTNSPSNNSTSGNKPRIYITSERPLEPQFEKYRLHLGAPKETNECVSNGESGGPEYSLSKRGFDTRTRVTNAIYITSERPLEPQFEKYRIKINPLDMHHVMAFASLYIGDSQTMAAEAGVLGVPFVHFNDFVGRIGYLRELEDKYELGYGIHASVLPPDSPIRRNDGFVQPSGVDALYHRVEQLVAMPSEQRRKVWASRRNQMLADKVDCAKFLTYFIENYPNSATEVKNATPDFWERFK